MFVATLESMFVADVHTGAPAGHSLLHVSAGVDGQARGCAFGVSVPAASVAAASVAAKQAASSPCSGSYGLKRTANTIDNRTMWTVRSLGRGGAPPGRSSPGETTTLRHPEAAGEIRRPLRFPGAFRSSRMCSFI